MLHFEVRRETGRLAEGIWCGESRVVSVRSDEGSLHEAEVELRSLRSLGRKEWD